MAKDAENTMDLNGSAAAQNLPANDPAIAKMRQAQSADLKAQEQSILGQAGFDALQVFNNEMPVRNLVSDAARLTLTSGTPMTGDQQEQVARLMLQNGAVPSSATQSADLSGVNCSFFHLELAAKVVGWNSSGHILRSCCNNVLGLLKSHRLLRGPGSIRVSKGPSEPVPEQAAKVE